MICINCRFLEIGDSFSVSGLILLPFDRTSLNMFQGREGFSQNTDRSLSQFFQATQAIVHHDCSGSGHVQGKPTRDPDQGRTSFHYPRTQRTHFRTEDVCRIQGMPKNRKLDGIFMNLHSDQKTSFGKLKFRRRFKIEPGDVPGSHRSVGFGILDRIGGIHREQETCSKRVGGAE